LQQITNQWSDCIGSPLIKHLVRLLTPSCRDLLDRVFVTDAKKRITMEELKQHPWFNRRLPERFERSLERVTQQQVRIVFLAYLQGIERVKDIAFFLLFFIFWTFLPTCIMFLDSFSHSLNPHFHFHFHYPQAALDSRLDDVDLELRKGKTAAVRRLIDEAARRAGAGGASTAISEEDEGEGGVQTHGTLKRIPLR
jgi:serine/threonine protein kinase